MISINNSEHWLIQQVIQSPEETAIKYPSKELTYKEFLEQCMLTAVFLKDLGIKEKNHVGILLDHIYKFFAIVNALWLIGAVPVPLSIRNSKQEIENQLKQADIKFLIHSNSFSEKLEGVNSAILKIELTDSIQSNIKKENLPFHHSAFCNLHPALILFTSGSSGKPKAVVHNFESLFESVKAIDSFSNLTPSDTWLSSLPLYHIGGFMILVRSLIVGCQVIFPSSLRYEDITDAIIKYHPSHFSVVSTTLKRFLNDGLQPYRDLKFLYLGGGPLDANLCLDAVKRNWPIVKSYGSTETCSMITALNPDELRAKPNSAGKVIGENEIKIVKKEKEQDHDHEQVKFKDIGEIAVQSKSLFKEYFDDQLSTDLKLRNGLYFTGDFGFIDDEEYLFIESRKEDLVITGGENVSTREVETIIKSFPNVTDVVVFGIPDDDWGQKLCAAVVAGKIDENDLRIFLKGKIAGYKIPKEYFFIDEIPKTEMGKVNRLLLFNLLNLS